jgi:DNA adenine methylase
MNTPAQPRRSLIRYFGGKWKIAPWIISHFPPHSCYTEAFGGAASVLLQKQRSFAEVLNDIDGEIVNLFRVIRENPDALTRALKLTPYARAEFADAFRPSKNALEQARKTIVRAGMCVQPSYAKGVLRSGFRNYSKTNRHATGAADWQNYPDCISSFAQRLQGVIIENRDWSRVLREHDRPDALHFVDPPYVHDSRSTTSGYTHEMTDADHQRLAQCLKTLTGTVILCGYESALYTRLFADWHQTSQTAYAFGRHKRTEILWSNRPFQKNNKQSKSPHCKRNCFNK